MRLTVNVETNLFLKKQLELEGLQLEKAFTKDF